MAFAGRCEFMFFFFLQRNEWNAIMPSYENDFLIGFL
jgi:hypothetical protein